jgi:hypothetical protein
MYALSKYVLSANISQEFIVVVIFTAVLSIYPSWFNHPVIALCEVYKVNQSIMLIDFFSRNTTTSFIIKFGHKAVVEGVRSYVALRLLRTF